MAGGGCTFSLLRSLYLITLVFINFVFSMNSFRLVHIESWSCRSLAPVRYTALQQLK
jgi:hypothetical protein